MGEIRDNLKKNLNYYLDIMNISQKTLSEKLNVSQAAVTNWVKGKNSPDIETVSEICKILNIKISDLLIEKDLQNNDILNLDDEQLLSRYHFLDDHGKKIVAYILNEQYNRCISDKDAKNYAAAYRWYISLVNKYGQEKANEIINKATKLNEYKFEEAEEQEETPKIKIRSSAYNKASAGTGYMLDNEEWETIEIPDTYENRQADFALTISGNSMEPVYHDGDIVLVKSQPQIEIGDIGIFIINDEGYIKKYGGDRLISLNNKYKDIKFSEGDYIKCCGKVIGRV